MDYLQNFLGKEKDGDMNDAKMMAELKAMGYEEDELDPAADAEEAELKHFEDELLREEAAIMKAAGGNQREIDVDSKSQADAKINDEDLDDPELMGELEEIAGEDSASAAKEHQAHLEELRRQAQALKDTALALKKAGNIEKAKAALKQMKIVEAQIATEEGLLKAHEAAHRKKPGKVEKVEEEGEAVEFGDADLQDPELLKELESVQRGTATVKLPQRGGAPQPVKSQKVAPPAEDLDFDYDSIVSMSVLQHELEQAKTAKDQDLVEKLDMAVTVTPRQLLETNIMSGILTQDKYVADVTAAIGRCKKQAAEAGAGLRTKLLKHVELMEAELSEPPEEEEEQAPPQPAKTAVSHETLMQNEVYSYTYHQLQELKDAFMYLRERGAEGQLDSVMKKAEACQKVVDRFKAGEVCTSYTPPLVPADLLGISEQQRLAELQKFSAIMQETQNEYKEKALAALRANDKNTAAQHKSKMVKFEKYVKLIGECRLNPWQPLPTLGTEELALQQPVLNQEVGENELLIILGEASGFAEGESFYAVCALPLNNPAVHNFTSRQVRDVNKHGFNHIEKVVLDPRVFQSLDRRRLAVEVFQHRTLRSDLSVGQITVKLAELEGHCTVESKLPLARGGPTLKVILQVRKALKKSEVKTVKITETVIVAIPPPFKKADGSYFAEKPAAPVAKVQVEEEKKAARSAAPQAAAQTAKVPQGLRAEELRDPSILDNLNSFEVLEAEKERLTALAMQYRDRDMNPAPILEKQREVVRKQALIQVQVEKGVISPEEYTKVLNQSIAHDIELAKYFREKQDVEKVKLIAERVKLMKKELEEMAAAPQ